jgi:hypothetical protein
MRTDGSLVGTRWGPISAIGPQPRRRHESEVWVATPTAPWRSRRLPRTLLAGDPRRTLFRTLLRRAEGVPVEFADGSVGTVEDMVFSVLGFDFWPQELVVATPDGRRRVSARSVRRIDVREPRIWVGPPQRTRSNATALAGTSETATRNASIASSVSTISSRYGCSPAGTGSSPRRR